MDIKKVGDESPANERRLPWQGLASATVVATIMWFYLFVVRGEGFGFSLIVGVGCGGIVGWKTYTADFGGDHTVLRRPTAFLFFAIVLAVLSLSLLCAGLIQRDFTSLAIGVVNGAISALLIREWHRRRDHSPQ